MDKADPRGRAVKVMKQAVEQIVAHKAACTVGNCARQSRRPDCFRHVPHREGRKKGRRAARNDRSILRHMPRVIGDGGVLQVDRHHLRRDGGASARLPDADDRLKLLFFRARQHSLRRLREHRRHLHHGKLRLSDACGKPLYRLPCRIDAFPAKGVKAGHQNLFHPYSLLLRPLYRRTRPPRKRKLQRLDTRHESVIIRNERKNRRRT